MSSKVEKRRMDIIRIVQSEGKAEVAEVAKAQGVTMETIRADFEYLAKQNGWIKTHGKLEVQNYGKYNQNYFFHDRQNIRMEEKKQLCFKAMELISDGDCIFIDSGSTVIYLLNYLNQKHNITIVTNSIGFLIRYTLDGFDRMFKEQGHRLLFLGGEAETNIMMTYGAVFEQSVLEFEYDYLIFSVDAMDTSTGGSNVDYLSYAAVKSVLRKARKKMLLVDGSKFDLKATYRIVGIEEVDYIVTDYKPLVEYWDTTEKKVKTRFILS